jgi:hypothetical protein
VQHQKRLGMLRSPTSKQPSGVCQYINLSSGRELIGQPSTRHTPWARSGTFSRFMWMISSQQSSPHHGSKSNMWHGASCTVYMMSSHQAGMTSETPSRSRSLRRATEHTTPLSVSSVLISMGLPKPCGSRNQNVLLC